MVKTILSVDVAVKTLALTWLEVDDDVVGEDAYSKLGSIRIKKWELIDCYARNGMTMKKPSISDAVRAVSLTLMSLREDIEGCDECVLEVQPMRRGPVSNPRSKCVSHVIESYCYFVGLSSVVFRQPRHKFLIFNEDMKSLKYNQRKKWSSAKALECLSHIKDGERFRVFYTMLKKSDDAADSLLQGCAHIIDVTKSKKRKRK